MALLIAHIAVLAVLSFITAARFHPGLLERLVTTVLLGWANIVVTSLLLAQWEHLGDADWFFRTSLLSAVLLWLVAHVKTNAPSESSDRPGTALQVFAFGTLMAITWIALRIGATYEPNNYDSLTYHLPRAMYYMGQGDLAHFDTGNPRQTYFPFNYNLLQLGGLIYGAPVQAVNFINLVAWAVAGLSLYRIGRLASLGPNAALLATWLTLTATQILAQATATTNDLPTGAGVLVTLMFILRWRRDRLTRDAIMAGVAAGLAAGSKLTVVFFGPAAGLIVLWLCWQHWRDGRLRDLFLALRAWVLPGILALGLASPFALINLAEKGEWINKTYDFTLNRPFSVGSVLQTSKAYLVQMFIEPFHRFTFDLQFTNELNAWGKQIFFPNWNPAYAFSPLYLFPPDLNEDHVWYGFTGPLILLAGAFALFRCRRERRPLAWLAALGLGWFATYFLLNKWSLYNQRYFVPAILILGPCLGVLIEIGWSKARWNRFTRNIIIGLSLCSLWLAGIYFFKNTSRPYGPLWAGQPPPAALPALPTVMVQRLAGEPKINIDTADGNERVFLFMNLGRHQRFTSFDRVVPDAYNLISRWGFVRKVAYSNIEQLSSYTTVAMPEKRTAGVEFLGTLGSGQPALDYYGLPPHPEEIPAVPNNRNVMVTFYYGPRDPGRYADMRIKVTGLNLPDEARLTVGVDYADGDSEILAEFNQSGDAPASVTRPFRRFTVRITDRLTGRELGSMDVPYLVRDDPTEAEAPHNPIQLFSHELITTSPAGRITTSGLAAPEGPYPQWNLPLIRWAKSPILRIEIPATKHLSRLQFHFELCLHARQSAQFDVRFNDELVAAYEWDTPTGWFIKDLTLRPKAGVNVIEIRNVTVGTEPDWEDYLARYPDVAHYLKTSNLPLQSGALEHYETFGRKENRIMHLKRTTTALEGDPLYYLFRSLHVEGFRSP
ncbi:MAG: glycosyltransferase family 39 protein [Opitutaceae bacterium]